MNKILNHILELTKKGYEVSFLPYQEETYIAFRLKKYVMFRHNFVQINSKMKIDEFIDAENGDHFLQVYFETMEAKIDEELKIAAEEASAESVA